MESLIKSWDGESVTLKYDSPTRAWIIIAVHSTRLGPATGGTRMKPYPGVREALEDALRLSAGMSYKFAVPDLPFGGGKGVIAVPPDLDPQSRAELLRRYGALIHQLGGLFYTGPDVGTSSSDMDIIAETGAPYIFARTPEAGGAGSSGPFTALGVFSGIQVTCEHIYGDASLEGRRVLVQGTGSVGARLIGHLRAAGADVIFSDVNQNAIRQFKADPGLTFVSPEAVYSTACEIFAPCALGGILNTGTIPVLKCRAIAGGANNQLATPQDADRLREKGILYIPDYVINVGGAMAICGIEIQGWTVERAEKEVVESVQSALKHIFDRVGQEGIIPEVAAKNIAEEHLAI